MLVKVQDPDLNSNNDFCFFSLNTFPVRQLDALLHEIKKMYTNIFIHSGIYIAHTCLLLIHNKIDFL